MGAGTIRTVSLGICLILLGDVMIPSRCELFTALVHMEGLLELEKELLASLNSYITAEKERCVERGPSIDVCTYLYVVKVAGVGRLLLPCFPSTQFV